MDDEELILLFEGDKSVREQYKISEIESLLEANSVKIFEAANRELLLFALLAKKYEDEYNSHKSVNSQDNKYGYIVPKIRLKIIENSLSIGWAKLIPIRGVMKPVDIKRGVKTARQEFRYPMKVFKTNLTHEIESIEFAEDHFESLRKATHYLTKIRQSLYMIRSTLDHSC